MTLSRSLSIALCFCILHQGTAFSKPQGALVPQLSIPNLFESKNGRRTQLKKDILELASETKRGLTATEDQEQEMERLFKQLESLNPTRNPLIINEKQPNVNGDWSLEYTTSDSILGKGGNPRVGPIIQNIDTTTLSAQNREVVRYGFVDVPRSVTSELSPVDGKFTDVKFKRFQLGPIGFDAPDKFRGSLDITYLDDEMRLTRGDKGNIFVLTRM
eukprot:CAMPEP_0184455954 /NCGR_PEP_ID=MMETSP0740-20130409/25243_1 /TAXON_ID=385413 /ORGANISM="Thalassiosira miniscula, Strain CCMP1093" /LENGTH=215 /DNA_ID=CAMNT_0026827937 /DNA_START=17 /DNA_END=664 /DNA_ORIENTATION=+